MRLAPYPKYKPSGSEWLGVVPAHWDVKRGRFLMKVNPSSERLGRLDSDDDVSFVPMKAVGEGGGLLLDEVRAISDVGTGYTVFDEGDTLVAKITPCFENGKGARAAGLQNGVGLGTTELHVLRASRGLDPDFLFYLTISQLFRGAGQGEMYGASGQKRVPPDFCKGVRLPLPSADEQRSIVEYLDGQTGRIDTLVAKNRILIQRLKEKRTAVISCTVTRGLLDGLAPAAGDDPQLMCRPSEVEGLGDVPARWEIKRLRRVAKFWVSNVDKVRVDDEVPVRLCNYTDVYYNERIRPCLGLMEGTATQQEISRFGLQVGDVLITKDSEDWRDIAIPALVVETEPDLVCGYHLAIIRPKTGEVLGEFLLRALQACAVNQQFRIRATGVTRYGLPKSCIGDASLPVPPPVEQRAIGDFLDYETAKIDSLVSKVEAAIERLREYRTALITATVTGQIDVRGVSA